MKRTEIKRKELAKVWLNKVITQPNQNDRKSRDFSYPTNWRVDFFFSFLTFQPSKAKFAGSKFACMVECSKIT